MLCFFIIHYRNQNILGTLEIAMQISEFQDRQMLQRQEEEREFQSNLEQMMIAQ